VNRKERIEFQTSGVLREGCNWGKKSGWVSLSALATESILSALLARFTSVTLAGA